MKKILIAMLIAAALLAACAVVPADRHGTSPGGVVIVPVLPSVVVLDAGPYYFYADFHYFFENERWYYSRSRRGPWTELPWDHYPRETRYRGKNWKYGRNYDERGPISVGVVIAPKLPLIVMLDADPYYFYGDFHYFFENERWYYSGSRGGPWTELPRDRYPKETRYRGRSWIYDRDRDNRGRGPAMIVIAPALPPVVVLEREPYYFYGNFHYAYDDNRWYYSKSKNGPWSELPRDRYPKETRYRGRSWRHDHGRDDDDRDNRDRYRRDRDRDDQGDDYQRR